MKYCSSHESLSDTFGETVGWIESSASPCVWLGAQGLGLGAGSHVPCCPSPCPSLIPLSVEHRQSCWFFLSGEVDVSGYGNQPTSRRNFVNQEPLNVYLVLLLQGSSDGTKPVIQTITCHLPQAASKDFRL